MEIPTGSPTKKASDTAEIPDDSNADTPIQPDVVTKKITEDENTVPEDTSRAFDSAFSDTPDDEHLADATNDADAEEPDVPIETETVESDGIVPADLTDKEVTVEDENTKFKDIMGLDRSEEVPALLGEIVTSDDEEPEGVPDQDTEYEDVAPEIAINATDGAEDMASAAELFRDLPDNRQNTAPIVEHGDTMPERQTVGIDFQKILDSLHDSLADTQYISAKIDAVSHDTDSLVKQVNSLAINYELLSAEMESLSSGAGKNGVLSKTFLTISSAIIALLVVFQIYTFISLVKTQQQQSAANFSALANINHLNKIMADYDKNLTKSLEVSTQQLHAQQNQATAEKATIETPEHKDASTANAIPVLERLNRLRNGLPEKRLIRKETGDWFIYNKKNDECISDVEVIDSLNQAYRKIGRSISTSIPMPAQKALCILKPDGKGGTQILMTKDFLP